MMPPHRAGRTGHLFLLVFLLTALCHITAPPKLRPQDIPSSFIRFEKEPGYWALADSGRCAPWLISSTDWPGVRRVAENVRRDLLKVTGTMPPLCVDSLSGSGECVIIGTIGTSPLLDRLVAANKIDLTGVAGQWESSVTQVVEEPLPGIRRALVIAGSDKRGTIYGLYELAGRIGVSAWHFWSDMPPPHHPAIYAAPGRYILGAPKVKYRGIFINDEAPALTGWAFEKFGSFNSRFYEHVFDLILRLKGNYLWPAMWGRMFYVEDPLNPQLADEYGVVIATSHHEPMMRAHAEWARFGTGKWNYEANAGVLQQFWREGIERMGKYESVVTVGMRGDGDEPMSEAANIALLERIVRDQRQIIAEVTGKPAEATPQVWALYKEVQEYYDRGMRVPDDVTLLLCDDNWGNIRKLPRPDDPPRRGGYGIYYHFDYVGDPRNYKWLNTNQISRTWEQMHLAWEMGARQIWIVNVGDIKPMELPIEFFLDYAWNPEAWPAERIGDYTRLWTSRQFGPGAADEMATLLEGYTRCNSRRKPELLAPETYSLTGHNEAERVAAEYQALAARSQRLYDRLPGSQRDAYYQLVHHPVTACANLNTLYLTVAKNRLYASQGRALTNALADSAAALFARDAAISRYYNQELAGGKWSHMMDQTHIGYTGWQQPDSNAMPAVERIALPAAAEMGVSIEGAALWWPDAAGEALLPEIDPYVKPGCWLEIFNRGAAPFMAKIHSGKKWLHAGPGRVRITGESRIFISADWSRVPPGRSQAAITVTGPGGHKIVVRARLHQPEAPVTALAGRFLESNGAAAMEAAHYSRAENRHGLYWQEIPELGRTLSGMTLFPVDAAPADTITDAPCLEYPLHWFSAGPVTIRAFLSPTLNFHHGQGLRCAMALNDEPPQIINIHAGIEWDKWVSDNIVVAATSHEITRQGAQRVRFWALDPGVVLQRLVVERPDAPATWLGPPETLVPPRVSPSELPRVPPQLPQENPEATAAGRVENPVLSGFYPDPSCCRVGDNYYLVTSSFAWYPGLPLFRSRDLQHWQQIGHVLDRPGQLDLAGHGVSRGLFAPTIRWHNGRFYVVCTLVDTGGNFVVTAPAAEGPWSDPVWLPEVNGIDPSLFFDDDGRAWLVYNSIAPDDQPLYDGHRTIRMRPFDVDKLQVWGDEKILINGGVDLSRKPVWIEAPHIFKRDGWYYLIAAEGGTAEQHSEVVFRCRSIDGPWQPWEHNPILTQRHLDPQRPAPVTCAGHADLVTTPAGAWWALFLGCRPYPPTAENHYNTGRETFIAPVQWQDGWPVINPGHAAIQASYPVGQPPEPLPTPTPTGGLALDLRDDFEANRLAANWQLLRTPTEPWYQLSGGRAVLRLRPEECSGRGNPSLLGHRQQHLWCESATALDFTAAAPGERAGLLIFQNESHYYFLAKSMANGRPVVQLWQSGPAGAEKLLHSAALRNGEGPLQLRIAAAGGRYSFYYAEKEGRWQRLAGDADGTFLSTRTAGGFVGAFFGLYATSSGKPAATTAAFDWFSYHGDDRHRP